MTEENGLDFGAIFRSLPTAYLVMDPELVILDANDAYLRLVGRSRAELVGTGVFDAFPPSEGDLDEAGNNAVKLSFERARDTGLVDPMPLQRYSIKDPLTGEVVERYWSLISAPVLAADGTTRFVLQRTEDVSDYVRQRQGVAAAESDPAAHADADPDAELLLRRVGEVEADLLARVRELRTAQEARDLAVRQLASVGEVALALTAAETVADVEAVVVSRGLAVLGADGGAVVSRGPDGNWRLTVEPVVGEAVRTTFASAAYDSPLPAIWCARNGQRVLLGTVAEGLAFEPTMAAVYEITQRRGWAFLPLLVRDQCLGSLVVAWTEEHAFVPEEVEALEGLAAQCAQAMERIRVTEQQRAAAVAAQRFSETLQRSMLTPPPQPDHLAISVRYQPAAEAAQIGGDWYDAFSQPDGATVLVIGDVVGHDGAAAALMGQLRGLLRALAYDPPGTLADVLTRVEVVARGLAVDVLASAVLARIERVPDVPGGRRTLRWSNAGHLPLMLLLPDGSSRLLEESPDLLLGVDPTTPRHDHTIELPDDSALLMFTDGLVERRDEGLDTGFARLAAAVADLGQTPTDELCDILLARMVADDADDDVALLALRAYSEDAPPPE